MGARCRFVHCADLHLGSRFRGVSAGDSELGRRMTESVFDSFHRIVDLALSEKADFMVISGDAFDEDTITPSTRSRFASELGRLGIPCFIARGNHDPRTDWESSIPYPENVHEFGTEPESLRVPGVEGVEVVGASFRDWHEERNLPSMVRGDPSRFTVACLHCDVDAAGSEYAYSPCRLHDLLGRGVDYWALGHIHKRAVLYTEPYIVYPGNIQGRRIKETGEKGCYLVTVEESRVSELRFVATQGIVWRDIPVDISGATVEGVLSAVGGRVSRGDIVRLRFSGSGEMDAMLRLRGDDLRSLIEARLGCVVCEMSVGTSPPIDGERRAHGSDMTAQVIRTGASLKAEGRQAVLDIILSNPIAARNRQFFESLTDEQLMGIVDRASGLLVAELEGAR